MKYAIEFHDVWKKFRKGEKANSLRDSLPKFFHKGDPEKDLNDKEFWALKNVSFNIDHGDVGWDHGALMGPVKAPSLKLLSRIMVPNKGGMKLNGRLAALIEVTAGFHPDLTGPGKRLFKWYYLRDA